ncbi:hypothetical protein Hanom_Chr14g01271601 [Helianthus anomalus]
MLLCYRYALSVVLCACRTVVIAKVGSYPVKVAKPKKNPNTTRNRIYIVYLKSLPTTLITATYPMKQTNCINLHTKIRITKDNLQTT